MSYTRTFALDTFTADENYQPQLVDIDLTGAQEIWVVGTLSWPNGYSEDFETVLYSSLDGVIDLRPIIQESWSTGITLSIRGDLRGVGNQGDLYIRIYGFDSGEHVDVVNLAAVLSYC